MASAPATATEDCAVVGGGVAGLWLARALRRLGLEVTVIERNRLGSGASHGNAGWISPLQAGPLPAPGMVAYGARSLVNRRSALHVAPREVTRMAGWLLAFARHCTPSAQEAGVQALAALGYPSLRLVEELAASRPALIVGRAGLLLAAAAPGAIEDHLAMLAPLRDRGHDVPNAVLSPAELRLLEPALSASVEAGVLLRDHLQVDPSTLLAELAADSAAAGVRIEEGIDVLELIVSGRRVVELRTTSGRRAIDRIVLAAGAWTAPLARTAGVSLPIVGGKGYSFDVEPKTMLARPVLLADAHVGLAPLRDGRLRIAGTMELSGLNLRLDRSRIEAIAAGAARALGPWRQAGAPWAGLRPITPDGLPVIGQLPEVTNAYVASGYGMLGLTLAPAAGELLAGAIAGAPPSADLRPFDPVRFRQWLSRTTPRPSA